MRYPLNERRVRVGFAFGDPWFNTGKRHTGEDDHASAGEPIYAPAAGTVTNHVDDPKWGHGIVLSFDGGDGCTLWHIDHFLPNGAHVNEGDQIGVVYDLQGNTHLHVSFWQGQYDASLTVGALPPSSFPGKFVEPDHYLDTHPDQGNTGGDMGKVDDPGDIYALKNALSRIGYMFIREDEPSAAELDNWLKDGHNDLPSALNDFVGILDSGEGQEFRGRIHKSLQATEHDLPDYLAKVETYGIQTRSDVDNLKKQEAGEPATGGGAAYDDTEVKSRLSTVEKDLANIKGGIA